MQLYSLHAVQVHEDLLGQILSMLNIAAQKPSIALMFCKASFIALALLHLFSGTPPAEHVLMLLCYKAAPLRAHTSQSLGHHEHL
jgi:hypothetical protein